MVLGGACRVRKSGLEHARVRKSGVRWSMLVRKS